MIGTYALSSMSRRARAVRFGRLPGIFLLMKWITCSLSGGDPCVDGGFAVCALARPRSRSLAVRCRLKPTSTMPIRMTLIVSGEVALRNIIAALLAGRNRFLPILRSRLRIAIETSPKSMSTGHGLRHLWQTCLLYTSDAADERSSVDLGG